MTDLYYKRGEIKCCWSPTLGELEGTAESTWGTPEYQWPKDKQSPTVFFGMYSLRDYYALWRHKGVAFILWAGSDIVALDEGWLFSDGKLKWLSWVFRGWFKKWLVRMLNKKAEHWVENRTERRRLLKNGIEVDKNHVRPSYMGDIKLKPKYRNCRRLHLFLCSPEGRQEEYGFGIIERIAPLLPRHKFHLYGAKWHSEHRNVIVHGRITKEQMNEEIANYQVGLRLNKHDGFSEITAKAILLGKHAITSVPFPFIPCFKDEDELVEIIKKIHNTEPDKSIREYYFKELNNYPWVC